MRTPAWAPRPVPTMIAMGVARPRAQGQAMMRTATAFTMAWAKRGSGPKIAQTMKVPTDRGDYGGDKPSGNFVGEFLNGRAAALGCADHANDLREHVFRFRHVRRA